MSVQQGAEQQHNEMKSNYKNVNNLKHFEITLHI